MNPKRHTDNHLMLERLMKIHAKIKSGCYPNVKQLAFDLEVSPATINRDIDFLKDRFNAPIVYDAKHRGNYYSEDYDMPLNKISPKDVMTLSTAKQLLSHYEGTPVFEETSRIIDFLCDTQTCGKAEFLNRIALPPSPKIIIDEKIWNSIVKAMQKNLKIEFDYNGRWKTETTHRKVHPYQLLLDEGQCFVFGFSEERNAERLFSLSRIKNLNTIEETFSLPADFDFNSRCAGGKFGTFLAEDSDEFVIEFYNDGRQYVKECIWAENQKITDYDDENRTEICFVSSQGLKIREWVLSQGANARPLKPDWFVKDWKHQIDEMRKLAER
ncbi:MAG: WYL domain-containing protein [Treponema sp.]|nr:WYL domain-containing protein [Treponema sp.]